MSVVESGFSQCFQNQVCRGVRFWAAGDAAAYPVGKRFKEYWSAAARE
jgi:hypothetical protein